MNSKRVSYLMIAGLAVLVLGILASTYFVNSMLEKQAKSLYDLKLKNKVLEEERWELILAERFVKNNADLGKIAKSIVPQDKDQARTVREITTIAKESGINLSSITFPSSTLGTGAAAAPTAPTTTPTTLKKPDANTLTQLTPVKGAVGLYALPITITQDAANPVPYNQFIDFLSRLEQNRRTALVTNIAIQPSPTNKNMLSFTLTVEQYIKP